MSNQRIVEEAKFAHGQSKKIFPFMGERGYTGGVGWLGMLTAGKILYDIVNEVWPTSFDENWML